MKQKIIETYDLLKDWFWALPLWKRVIMTSLIGSIGGSTVVGFINKYALYYHALCQNFRVPIEGVEYIDLAVTMVSFAFFLTSLLATIIIYSLLNFISKFTNKKLFDETKVNKREIRLYSISLVISFLGVITAFTSKIYRGNPSLEELRTTKIQFDINEVLIQLIIAIIFISIIVFSKKENSRKIFTLTFVFCLLISISVLLFNQNFYKSFLKTIQYGGNIPVKIEYRKADNTESTANGQLLIRTNTSLTIKNSLNNNIEEIPSERISKIIFLKN